MATSRIELGGGRGARHPLGFFARYSGFSAANLNDLKPVGPGRCDSCGETVELLNKKPAGRCAVCYVITKQYPKPPNQFTLGPSDFALIKASGSVFYTNLLMPRGVRAKPVGGRQIHRMMLDLIQKPLSEHYLLVHFGKPTITTDFRLNRGRDFIHVSGEVMDGRTNIASVRAWLVRDLLRRFPKVEAKEWSTIVAGSNLFGPDGETAARDRQQLESKYPGIFDHLPAPQSIEYKLIEVASDV